MHIHTMMHRKQVLVTCLLLPVLTYSEADQVSSVEREFIDDGLATRPPMGWRSWNSFAMFVDEETILDTAKSLVKKRNYSNARVSLADLGYTDVGLDDGYQDLLHVLWRDWTNGHHHDKDGNIIISKHRFPDMKEMNDKIHDMNLTSGFYLNNCLFREQYPDLDEETYMNHMKGDVKATTDWGFDSVKIDGCSVFLDFDLWQTMFRKTNQPVMIENCHWGWTVPTKDWCPFHMFRVSKDIMTRRTSWYENLQRMVKFSDWDEPISGPDCWAYPDMLQVGQLESTKLDRSHFASWCITSSPLVIGMDVRDVNEKEVKRVWNIIANREAIAINQAWAGHPGGLFKSWTPERTGNVHLTAGQPCQKGWRFDEKQKRIITPSGKCLSAVELPMPGIVTETCNSTKGEQSFDLQDGGVLRHSGYGPAGLCVLPETFAMPWGKSDTKIDILNTAVEYGPAVLLEGCHWYYQQKLIVYHPYNWTITADSRLVFQEDDMCLGETEVAPMAMDTHQIWAKPLPKKKHDSLQPVAAVALNMGANDAFFSFSLKEIFATVLRNPLEMSATHDALHIRDIHARRSFEHVFTKEGGTWADAYVCFVLGADESAFLKLTPFDGDELKQHKKKKKSQQDYLHSLDEVEFTRKKVNDVGEKISSIVDHCIWIDVFRESNAADLEKTSSWFSNFARFLQ